MKYASGGICDGDLGQHILQPINADGLSVFNSKSTSPAKFRVCDAKGVSIGTPGVVNSFVLYQVASGTAMTTVNEPVDSTTPDVVFRWDPTSQQWIGGIHLGHIANVIENSPHWHQPNVDRELAPSELAAKTSLGLLC